MNATVKLAQLAEIIDVASDGQVLWFGQPMTGIIADGPASPASGGTIEVSDNTVVERFLYDHFYSQGGPVRANRTASRLSQHASKTMEPFAIVDDTHCWQPGWTVLANWDDRVLLGRDGLAVWFESRHVTLDPISESARAWLPLARPNISPGFRSITSGSDSPLDAEVRVYWSLTKEAVEAFVARTVDLIARCSLSLSAKVAERTEMYTRADAAVMYMSETTYRSAIPHLLGIYSAISDHIKPTTPSLTLKLADGVGLAESPIDGRSFGQFVCAALTGGVSRIGRERVKSVCDKLAVLRQSIETVGSDADAVYLQPGRGSTGYTAWGKASAAGLTLVRSNGHQPREHADHDSVRDRALKTAEAIGDLIVQRALVAGPQCTWMGGVPATYHDDPSRSIIYRTLGQPLYDGAAGVGVFLAGLSRSTNNGMAALTARRAMQFSLNGGPRNNLGVGLYDGSAGVHVAVDLVDGLLTDRKRRATRGAMGLLGAAEEAVHDSPTVDLLSGHAGVLLALLSQFPSLTRRELNTAIALGEMLLANAVKKSSGLAWPSAPSIAKRPLLGMSHGVSGIALALAVLAAVSEQERFRDAAQQAMDYENSLFDEASGNWPDYRLPPQELDQRLPRPSLSFWCHGAPGILLSRVLIDHLGSGDPTWVPEALEKTRAAIRESLMTPGGDMSLCHGLSGLIDILLHATQMPDTRDPGDLESIRGFVDAAARIMDSGQGMPCGTHGGETPSAMLGLAGIGMVLLRIHDETLPSLLNPTRIASASI